MTAPKQASPDSGVLEQTPAMTELVAELRAIVAEELSAADTAARVGDRLRPFLERHDLLRADQREGDEQEYRQHLLHAEEDGSFSVVSLVWLPGQRTPVHDHVSWCVVGVYLGAEVETRYRLVDDGATQFLVPEQTSVNPLHSTCGFAPPGDIHEVHNDSAGKAISIHVYGADIRKLGSSVRRRYDLPVRAS
ncbi:putative metal-dependent enzyme (double-stranded beta helix superfamily) [Tamaricihabitans halophyticus]|uniref:Putative metal-dependent enzyme (Double-stranded beta helix superfamily) n=1 Tax=Tamaricihabitans halophyticus TaxID=1262583 RepID=A0A4R2QZ69_9PSEU|nr:cysteine dioxygenase family protein [Tamaricihabitans halophyticus]TCP54977.1 putative metal-dependent enzyme (double-stranded beta helix superfamily) [Tamaricihabitans halophyticus]